MTCRELLEFLDDYRTDGLLRSVREDFERHLEACPECVHYVESYELTVRLGREACRDEATDRPAHASAVAPAPEALIRAILASRNRR